MLIMGEAEKRIRSGRVFFHRDESPRYSALRSEPRQRQQPGKKPGKWKIKMNAELKKIMGRVKQAQGKIQKVMKEQDWLEEARKYAERQGTEVKKLFSSDSSKVEAFLERQRKELEKIQKRIPGEVKKYRTLLQGQSKELEKILGNLIAGSRKKASSSAKKSRSSKVSGAKTRKKKSSSNMSATS